MSVCGVVQQQSDRICLSAGNTGVVAYLAAGEHEKNSYSLALWKAFSWDTTEGNSDFVESIVDLSGKAPLDVWRPHLEKGLGQVMWDRI